MATINVDYGLTMKGPTLLLTIQYDDEETARLLELDQIGMLSVVHAIRVQQQQALDAWPFFRKYLAQGMGVEAAERKAKERTVLPADAFHVQVPVHVFHGPELGEELG